MPTFASIDLHHDLRQRLVSVPTHSHSSSSSQLQQHQSSVNRRTAAQQRQSHPPPQPIRNPQSLLSRNPKTLHLLAANATTENNDDDDHDHGQSVSSRPIALEQAQKLRLDVAHALMSQTKAGQYIRRVQQHNKSSADSVLGCRQDKNETTPSCNHRLHSKKRDNKHRSSIARAKVRWSIPGAVSALDLLSYHSSLHQQLAAATTTTTTTSVVSPNGTSRPVVASISTGCRALDLMLSWDDLTLNRLAPLSHTAGGGLPYGYVTQFAGPPASGKTQLALHLAATNAAAPSPQSQWQRQTWYICGSGSGSGGPAAQRLADLCRHDPTVLHHVVLCPASSSHDVLRHLAELETRLETFDWRKAKDNEQQTTPTMLILDSCSACLSVSTPFKRGFKKTNDTLLFTVAATIRRLTRFYQLATVLINGNVANRDPVPTSASHTGTPLQQPTNKPALGHRWNRSVADICVWLESSAYQAEAPVIHATLERHVAKGGWGREVASFRITASGIQDVPTSHQTRTIKAR